MTDIAQCANNADMANLLSTAEAAEVIGVERSTLTRWVQLGRIAEAHKVDGPNGIRLFDADEVERAAKEYAAERAGATS